MTISSDFKVRDGSNQSFDTPPTAFIPEEKLKNFYPQLKPYLAPSLAEDLTQNINAPTVMTQLSKQQVNDFSAGKPIVILCEGETEGDILTLSLEEFENMRHKPIEYFKGYALAKGTDIIQTVLHAGATYPKENWLMCLPAIEGTLKGWHLPEEIEFFSAMRIIEDKTSHKGTNSMFRGAILVEGVYHGGEKPPEELRELNVTEKELFQETGFMEYPAEVGSDKDTVGRWLLPTLFPIDYSHDDIHPSSVGIPNNVIMTDTSHNRGIRETFVGLVENKNRPGVKFEETPYVNFSPASKNYQNAFLGIKTVENIAYKFSRKVYDGESSGSVVVIPTKGWLLKGWSLPEKYADNMDDFFFNELDDEDRLNMYMIVGEMVN